MNISTFLSNLEQKTIELRQKYPKFNNLCAKIGMRNEAEGIMTSYNPEGIVHYTRKYIVAYNKENKMIYYQTNPEYPRDFRPFNFQISTLRPILSGEELKKHLPIEFAEMVHRVIGNGRYEN